MKKKMMIFRLPHGYFKGGVMRICPSITISSFHFNNFVIEYEDNKNNEVGILHQAEQSKPK